MANGRQYDKREIEFRKRWYEAHAERFEADLKSGAFSVPLPRFWEEARPALDIRDRLAEHQDVERFRNEITQWSDSEVAFKGPNGGQLINSLVKHTDDRDELARLLVEGLTAPGDRAGAARKIDALAQHIERIKVGANPNPTNLAFMLAYFWAQEDPEKWPISWPSSRGFLESSTGTKITGSPSERYLRFLDLVEELGQDYARLAQVTRWWADGETHRTAFLDPVLVDRCDYARDPEAIPPEALRMNAAALVGIAKHLSKALANDVSEALDHPTKAATPGPNWRKGHPRADLWTDWRVVGEIGIRLWINRKGLAIGINPGLVGGRRGWSRDAYEIASQMGVDGFRIMGTRDSKYGDDVGFMGRAGSFIYGRWYEPEQLGDLDLRSEVVEVATEARPLLETLVSLAQGKPPQPEVETDPLDVAANDLLVERSFLGDIKALLEDKGQVILYGPPGTGKTYLAQRLAKALAPDSRDRTLVQFHPSTSYEDFFEGYRPGEGRDGRIVYRMTPGPLARMAARAAEYPHNRQVMVIDEINRANLPRALGELLFLFEYRDQPVSTLYRPDEEFELPESLWFIGTMNTADRSIALVDAALRRRFHFVPFFPDRGPTAGLLERWLEREEQPAWVAELVKMVNRELTEAIGADLQVGASHFMKTGYGPNADTDDALLRRIWEYNIEPLIEDQLFGDPGRIEHFRFSSVVARYRSSTDAQVVE